MVASVIGKLLFMDLTPTKEDIHGQGQSMQRDEVAGSGLPDKVPVMVGQEIEWVPVCLQYVQAANPLGKRTEI